MGTTQARKLSSIQCTVAYLGGTTAAFIFMYITQFDDYLKFPRVLNFDNELALKYPYFTRHLQMYCVVHVLSAPLPTTFSAVVVMLKK